MVTGFGWASVKAESKWFLQSANLWFMDTIITPPPDRPKKSARRNKFGVIGWDAVLRMDGVRGEPYPQNHCPKIWL